MNFCKFYNRTMNKLKVRHSKVSKVNIITGMLQIIAVLFVVIFDYITRPIRLLIEYITKHVHIPTIDVNSDIYNYIIGTVLFGVVFFVFVSMVYTINHWIAWLVFLPFIYMVGIFVVACIISIFNEEYGMRTVDICAQKPLNYILNKTTSHCDLINKKE